MRKLLFAGAAAALLLAGAAASSAPASARGADIGPLGQCFDPPDCGGHHEAYAYHRGASARGAYAYECPFIRERIVLPGGKIVHHMRHVCR
jgi:hypothetical protein